MRDCCGGGGGRVGVLGSVLGGDINFGAVALGSGVFVFLVSCEEVVLMSSSSCGGV